MNPLPGEKPRSDEQLEAALDEFCTALLSDRGRVSDDDYPTDERFDLLRRLNEVRLLKKAAQIDDAEESGNPR